MVYCIKVYVSSRMDGGAEARTRTGSVLPMSLMGSLPTTNARQAYRRIRRIVKMQWRGFAMVMVIIFDCIYFSIIFVYLNGTTQISVRSLTKAEPWLVCLAVSGGDKQKCQSLASKTVLAETTVVSVLYLLAVSSIEVKLASTCLTSAV